MTRIATEEHESEGSSPGSGISHTNLRDAVAGEIRLRIQDGTHQPGTRLQEESLAADLGVSRNPVREALQILAREGFVVIEPRRGARVASIDSARAAELFEVRQALERLVAELAAAKATPESKRTLRSIVERGREAVSAHALSDLPMLNTEFHAQLSSMAANTLLDETLSSLSGVIRWIYTERLEDRLLASWEEHHGITLAIEDGDHERAGELAARHVASAREAFFRLRA